MPVFRWEHGQVRFAISLSLAIGVGMAVVSAAAADRLQSAGPAGRAAAGRRDTTAPSHDELLWAQRWTTDALTGARVNGAAGVGGLPFSFRLGGKPSGELLQSWVVEREQRDLDRQRTRYSTSYTDPKSGLIVRCEAVAYHDFPTIEWTLYFRNTHTTQTPVLSDIRALDTTWKRPSNVEFVLHHAVGSPADGSDYGPRDTRLSPGTTQRISAKGGRPSNSDLPYFNLQWGGEGAIVVVGWPGQWEATFARDDGKELRVRAGQQETHFVLRPGEEVRSPLIVLQFWKGDPVRAQNIWRRWMMAHSMPRPGGHLPPPQLLASSSRAYGEMIGATEQNQIMHIDRYLEEHMDIDYWWMDAGWYVQQKGWPQVGTWEVDRKRFPGGLRPISDHAHARGVKILVWFEPERVTPGTWLYDHHPEWLLAAPPDRSNPVGGLCRRYASELSGDPSVSYNPTDRPLKTAGITWEPGRLACHPGPKGEYSVVRWTASHAGPISVTATFVAIDQQTTTDVHVLHNGQSLFSGRIDMGRHRRQAEFRQALQVANGDRIDWVVGYGNGSHTCDSTGIGATVTTASGTKHDAAKQFQVNRNPNGAWSYGYLPPGPRPDGSGFHPYDAHQVVGDNGWRLLDLGNPQTWSWLVDHIDTMIREQGIDIYRQDFNIDPLRYWRAHDSAQRRGMTEIRYVTAYLAFWDELRRRHPALLIDSCASGGRRNDLETMRRAVPLWRSDYAFHPIGQQCMTYGISSWIPYHGTGTVACANASYYGAGPTPVEPYAFWSNAAPSLVAAFDIRVRKLDYDALRRLFRQWRRMSLYYDGDYYPLTPYSRTKTSWIAWQFHRPGQGDGAVQAFRRDASPERSRKLKLRGLDAAANYRFTNLGDGHTWQVAGSQLIEQGLSVTIDPRPGAAVFTYDTLP